MRGLLTVGLIVLVSAEAAADEEIRASQQANLILRILGHDRNLTARAGETLTIIVLYREGIPDSEAVRSEIVLSLEDAGKRFSPNQLPIRVATVPYSSAAKLESALAAHHAAAIYVCPGLADNVPDISKAARAQRALSFSSKEEYVKDGLGVALVARRGSAVIVVNLPVAKAAGADLSSELLRLAEVFR